MKAFLVLLVLAISSRQIYGDVIKCGLAVGACSTAHLDIIANPNWTCEQKAPLFKCLRDGGCDRSYDSYKNVVASNKYEGCGASSIIMGWTLPILMLSLVKYFTN